MLLNLLPKNRFPIVLRYGATCLIIGVAVVMRLALDAQLQNYPLLLFFPAVFLAALLFDKGSGFFATLVSAGIAAFAFMEPRWSLAIGWGPLIPLAIFVVVGFTMAGVTEALRQSVQRLAAAEGTKTLLLEELGHRTKNDLAVISSTLSLQARSSRDPAVRTALEAAIARVGVVARAQERLRGDIDGGRVDLPDYLKSLAADIGDLLRDVRPIAVRVRSDPMMLTTSQAVTIGLIVNELVTNALKYAFPGDGGGTVEVDAASADGTTASITVRDDGIGCPGEIKSGLGSRLVSLLAKQYGGTAIWRSHGPGCEVVVTLDFGRDRGS